MKVLIESGSLLSPLNDSGESPLYCAAHRGHLRVVSLLRIFIEGSHPSQAHPPLSVFRELEDALCNASGAGKINVVRQLLNIGIDPDSKSKEGTSALILAIQEGYEDIVSVLLEYDVDASRPALTASDEIPLHQAIRHRFLEIAELLLDSGVPLETKDDLGRSALFETIHSPNTDEIEFLFRRFVDVSVLDSAGNSPLHDAAASGAYEHVLIYVNQGVDMNLMNKDGLTPLHLAAQNEHSEIIDLLMRKGANVHIVDQYGKPPLSYAASV